MVTEHRLYRKRGDSRVHCVCGHRFGTLVTAYWGWLVKAYREHRAEALQEYRIIFAPSSDE